MAQYRLSVQVAKRSQGRSATAMAAYRAGESIYDKRTGERFDYSRKSGILFTQVIVPPDAPPWAQDRAQLWNRSEEAARRGDAIVAREVQLSLPHELSGRERQELTTGFARFLSDRYGVAVDTCIHEPSREGDERNYHAHLMICTRPFDESKPTGLGNNIRDFDAVARQRQGQGNEVELWRATWARQINEALERAGVRDDEGAQVYVDHRSYQRQGVAQEPTIKEGAAVTAAKRRGEYAERAALNEQIRSANAERHAQEPEQGVAQGVGQEKLVEQWERELQAATAQLHELKALRDGSRRRAEQMISRQLQSEILLPANDNEGQGFSWQKAPKPLPGETLDEAKQRAQEAMERNREQAQWAQQKEQEEEQTERRHKESRYDEFNYGR